MRRDHGDRRDRRGRRALGLVALLIAGVAQAQTVAIVGGRVFPVSGPPIEGGTVIIRDGRITAVGRDVAVPEGAQRVDASGKWVTPGIINPATQLGLVEVGQVGETRNATARGRDETRVNAAFTVWDGLNPLSVLFAPARNEGITTVAVMPAGGLVSGQAALVDIVDGGVSEMLVRSPIAMIAQIGNPQGANVSSRGELLLRLRELLEDSRAYGRRRADYERAQTREFAASRLDLEAMQQVLAGRVPLLVVADKASDIEAALRLAREYGLRLIIGSGAEAWMVADKLVAAKVPVMVGSMVNIPGSFATLGARQENPGLLRRAGVDVALIGTGSDPDAYNVRNIKQEAGNAVAYGMTWDDALRAITLTPAEIFGVADRYGSLQPGRVANVVVWSGDPFELSTRVEHVFVRGVRSMSPSRQDELMARYKTLPPAYRNP
ncbi:MAG TPA: amidohydrolase family protein [Gemmatimonadaceae bacterium]|nr:amidohydrolase family protein [Gemmatimonadaceae bacterium]